MFGIVHASAASRDGALDSPWWEESWALHGRFQSPFGRFTAVTAGHPGIPQET
jgi:hypothetical protein